MIKPIPPFKVHDYLDLLPPAQRLAPDEFQRIHSLLKDFAEKWSRPITTATAPPERVVITDPVKRRMEKNRAAKHSRLNRKKGKARWATPTTNKQC